MLKRLEQLVSEQFVQGIIIVPKTDRVTNSRYYSAVIDMGELPFRTNPNDVGPTIEIALQKALAQIGRPEPEQMVTRAAPSLW